MNRNTITIVLCLAVLGTVLSTYFINKKRSGKRAIINDAIKSFRERVEFDSAYAKNDTVRFYRNDSLVGSTVVVFE